LHLVGFFFLNYSAVYPRRSISFTNKKGTEEEWPLAKHIEYNLIGCFRKEYKQTGKDINKMCGLLMNNDGKHGACAVGTWVRRKLVCTGKFAGGLGFRCK